MGTQPEQDLNAGTPESLRKPKITQEKILDTLGGKLSPISEEVRLEAETKCRGVPLDVAVRILKNASGVKPGFKGTMETFDIVPLNIEDLPFSMRLRMMHPDDQSMHTSIFTMKGKDLKVHSQVKTKPETEQDYGRPISLDQFEEIFSQDMGLIIKANQLPPIYRQIFTIGGTIEVALNRLTLPSADEVLEYIEVEGHDHYSVIDFMEGDIGKVLGLDMKRASAASIRRILNRSKSLVPPSSDEVVRRWQEQIWH